MSKHLKFLYLLEYHARSLGLTFARCKRFSQNSMNHGLPNSLPKSLGSKIFQDLPRNSSISWRSASLWGLIEAQKAPAMMITSTSQVFDDIPRLIWGSCPRNRAEILFKMLEKCWVTRHAWRENGSKCYPKDVES